MKTTSERKQNLARQWLFSFGADHGLPFVPKAKGIAVDLPHDFSIIQERNPKLPDGDSIGFFPGGVATYEKTISVPKMLKGKRLLLEFEGVYMNAAVFLNDSLVTRQPYGYTTFHCDVTPHAQYGQENRISVVVNNGTQPNSRWYSGSGIYRHVWLHVLDSVCIAPWGVFATTPTVSPELGTVSVRTIVENRGLESAEIEVRSTLMDASGKKVAAEIEKSSVSSNSSVVVFQELMVDLPNLWGVESPYLYSLTSEVIQNNDTVDHVSTSIGIRSISFDAKNGFRLNGIPMKLRGGCVHADNGPLGAACYDRAEERKVELLKASGFNAVRCVHNPPSPTFLDVCDRLGMLVIDEAFDCWREGKTDNDYSLYFDDWWQRDLAAMIRRDRNHPSVIMWSIGNEIREIKGTSDGFDWARRLADSLRNLDDSRAVTSALQEFYLLDDFSGSGFDFAVPEKIWNEHSSRFGKALDVVGINYGRFHYDMDGKNFPDRVIVGCESYPQLAFDYWSDVKRLPYVIGDFVWTAWDYLGEAGLGRVIYGPQDGFLGKYPWLHSNCGDIDICGFKRPQSFYRDCVWGHADAPFLAVYDPGHHTETPNITLWGWPDVAASWTWPGHEGKPTIVDVYSTDNEVELILNGRSLGRKPAGEANRYIASFEVVYEPGELVAVGYRNGMESSRSSLKTAGAPASIRLTPDRDVIEAAYGDLSYVTVEMVDADGILVPNGDHNIHFVIKGPGTLLAVGSSDPKTEETYTGNRRRLYNGRALVVIRSDGEEGDIELKAETEGISVSKLVIKANESVIPETRTTR